MSCTKKYKLKIRSTIPNFSQFGGMEGYEIVYWPQNNNSEKQLHSEDFVLFKPNDDPNNYNKPEDLNIKYKLTEYYTGKITSNGFTGKVLINGDEIQFNNVNINNEPYNDVIVLKPPNNGVSLRFYRKIPVDVEKNNTSNKENKNEKNITKEQNTTEINSIEEKITELKKEHLHLQNKISYLEKKFENHYHIMPTSGVKNFEEKHPYFNEKID